MHTHKQTHDVVEDTGTAQVSKQTGLLDIHVVTLQSSHRRMRETFKLPVYIPHSTLQTHTLLERHKGRNSRLYLGWRVRGCIVVGFLALTKKER